MRVKLIEAVDIPPIQQFNVSDLSNVVVLAGPNGVGKTRLIQGILQAFQAGVNYPNIRLVIEATSKVEANNWGKNELDTSMSDDTQKLIVTLQQNRRRSTWQSSVIQFESDRTIQQIQPFNFSWDVTDPFQEFLDWTISFTPFKNRWHDTVHSLFRKVRSRREQMAQTAERLIKQGQHTMALDFPDPLLPFKDAFRQLLAPKELLDPEAKLQQLYYTYEGQQFPIDSLSSGEREVVNIVFDFLLRNPWV